MFFIQSLKPLESVSFVHVKLLRVQGSLTYQVNYKVRGVLEAGTYSYG